jgi:glucosylceramidase
MNEYVFCTVPLPPTVGIGLHWYTSVEDYLAWLTKPFDKMRTVADKYPDKFMLATEACVGFIPVIDQGPKLGNWQRAERYGFDILYDLNAFAVGWTDWNIALDMGGGPNWAGNVVDAPILIDTEDGATFYKNPLFYYMGHFSKFLTPGSRRVGVSSTAPPLHLPMEVTAFLTPGSDRTVVVVLNRDDSRQQFSISVKDDTRGFINIDMPANTIQTFIF